MGTEFLSVPDVDLAHPPPMNGESGEYQQYAERLEIFRKQYARSEPCGSRPERGSPEFRRFRPLKVPLPTPPPRTGGTNK